MKLTENYKNRIGVLAGIKLVSESLHPQFMDCGFYNMSNGNPEILEKYLIDNDIKYTYDGYRNFITIETNNPRGLFPIFDEAYIKKIEWKEALERNMDKDPNDCVLVRLPAPNVPHGAMM